MTLQDFFVSVAETWARIRRNPSKIETKDAEILVKYAQCSGDMKGVLLCMKQVQFFSDFILVNAGCFFEVKLQECGNPATYNTYARRELLSELFSLANFWNNFKEGLSQGNSNTFCCFNTQTAK